MKIGIMLETTLMGNWLRFYDWDLDYPKHDMIPFMIENESVLREILEDDLLEMLVKLSEEMIPKFAIRGNELGDCLCIVPRSLEEASNEFEFIDTDNIPYIKKHWDSDDLLNLLIDFNKGFYEELDE